MTSSPEFPPQPARLSDAERDRALRTLREGVAQGKLSHDTFVRRMELVLSARQPEELVPLVDDLRAEGRVSRALFGAVGAVSGFTVRMRRSWRTARLPVLAVDRASTVFPLRIGRDPANGLRLSHETVSRVHAELDRREGLLVLRDLGSANGTSVNGQRVLGATMVRDGDQVDFGSLSYRLVVTGTYRR